MLMPDTNYGNLSAAVITSGGATSSTSIEVSSTDGAIFPAAPFYATIMATGALANANNSEIVKVTAKATAGGITTLTITRAQRGTSAVSWAAGEAIIANSIYTEDVLSQSQGYYEAILSSGALFTITNASAPTTPVIGSRIRLTFDTTIPTAETVTLAINGGTAYEVDCHGATFATVGSVTNKVIIATNKVYTLEFDGTRWLMSNIASTILTNDIANNAVTTAKIANGAVTSQKIDWTTLFLGSPAMGWNDGTNGDYVDNRNDGWSGYNFNSIAGVYGTCTAYYGQWGKDQMGGGIKVSSSAKKGIYLVVIDINAFGEGTDGYKPFRVLKNTTSLTGDVGVPMRGGGVSTTLMMELQANDIINLQIYTVNTNRATGTRSWCRCYFLRPS